MAETDLGLVTGLLALEEAAPTEVVGVLEQLLEDRFGARGTRLWLADYRQTVLRAVDGVEQRAVDGTTEGGVFAAQEPLVIPATDGAQVFVPVTAPSNRLGVLALLVGNPPSPDRLDSLVTVGRALGRSITVANRHTDQFEQATRAQRLSLAAELQWQILPGRGCRGEDFQLAGQLEPAYHVAGDAFDWSVGDDWVTLSVHEGMDHGTAAAQATNLAVTALRNARRAKLGLADQAAMSHEALYRMYGGSHCVETLLLAIHRGTGQLQAVDAGSPLLLCQHDDRIEPVSLERQLPLGKFQGTRYMEETRSLSPGDRVIVVTDGVYNAPGSNGKLFGEVRLGKTLKSTRHLVPSEAVRHLIRELAAWHAEGELTDDAVAVVLDWTP